MDFQSTYLLDICKEMGMLAEENIESVNNLLELQKMKMDSVCTNLISQAAQREQINICGPEKKISKKSKVKNVETGDLFSAESNFQQPVVPPLRRTKRQASMLAVEKLKGVRESATISSSGGCSTRASRARAISTFIEDLNPFNGPKANSTFVVSKKDMGNVEEFLSPQNMFSPENDSNIKAMNANHTYNIKSKSKTNLKKKSDKTEDSPSNISKSELPKVPTSRSDSKNNSVEPEKIDKQLEKLEDIDVNLKEQPSQTRTKKRKLQEENQITEACVKKANVIHVPLEIQTSTPNKPLDVPQTPHQIRENEAEKRKEMYLRSKADKKKFEDQHLKVTKQREVQMKLAEEKYKKTAEDKKKKEEAQRLKELRIKEELLKRQKQQAELNSKRKQALEARVLLKKKEEIDRKVKENELKKKNELKQGKNLPEVVISPLRSGLPKPMAKSAVLPKTKTGNNESDKNENDYDLNDMSARDSSDDESGPKKKVPIWALRENRAPVLELQYHVDAQERDAFFNCPKVIDLQETFAGWPIRNRQRTSSAIWNTPPRFSDYIRNQRQ